MIQLTPIVCRAKSKWYKPKKGKKLILISQFLTVQILTNDVQVLILCLSYFNTTVQSKNRANQSQQSSANLTITAQPRLRRVGKALERVLHQKEPFNHYSQRCRCIVGSIKRESFKASCLVGLLFGLLFGSKAQKAQSTAAERAPTRQPTYVGNEGLSNKWVPSALLQNNNSVYLVVIYCILLQLYITVIKHSNDH